MYQWRPSQWIKWAPLTVLPFIAGSWLQTGGLVDDVAARAEAAAGDWAKVVLDGRDVVLSGEVKSKAILSDAVKAVAGTYGVRTVDVAGVKILPLAAPVVQSLTSKLGLPEITGTWPQDVAKTLTVTLNNKAYEFGKDAELTSTAGNFVLKPAEAIADGAYDVMASVSDGDQMSTAAAAPGKLVIDTVAPAVPALAAPAAGAVWPFAITGTWPEGDATGLSAKLADKTYTLGTDDALKSDGKGNFTFDPKVELKSGSYDLSLMVADAAGNQTVIDSKAAIVVADAAGVVPELPKAEAMPLAMPTIVAPVGNSASPMLSGSYPADAGKLSVAVGGKTYVLGTDKELTADAAGNWTLNSAPLADGDYSVGAKVEDAAGTASMSQTQSLTIDTKGPAAPTVNPAAADAVWPYAVTGTWPEGDAKIMSLSLAGQAYTLGKDKELISDGKGAYTFLPSTQLAPGSYDIDFTVIDGLGNISNSVAKAAVVIPEIAVAVEPAPAVEPPPPPAAEALTAPTVESVVSDSDHPTVKGTWPAGKANSLVVSLDGTSYKLGTDFDLLSDASGKWTLKPKAALVNGTYDVIAQITDAAGQSAIDATKGELQVNVAPPPPAPPAGQPYDCVTTMARISAVFPVRFEFNHDDLKTPFDLAVNQYSSLLKDARCTTLKVQVAGHADYKGSERYNQGLSERRAKTVIDALVAAGIDAGRLTGVGYSKDKPLDPALTDSARMKNRRVEFTVLN